MRGFILIESLVSAGLVAAVSIFLFCLLNCCATNSDRSSKFVSSVLYTESRMEALKSVDFSALSSEAGIIISDVDPDTKSIELRNSSLSLFTIRSRY